MGNAITNPLSYENKKKIYNSETFSNLEDAIAHKEWLVNNGPNNKESKYYYYETVEVKNNQLAVSNYHEYQLPLMKDIPEIESMP